MDKLQAQKIIVDTFENSFEKIRFTNFIRNLLNKVEEAPFLYRGNLIPDAYEQYISTLERVGKYTDGENKIDILIAKLKKETSIERARTMQRNFIAWYLNGSRGGDLKDAALVAFVAPNEEDWRFSLVKMDYIFKEDTKGRTRVKQEFTPARRWSFLVGVNEKSHTAKSRLVPILVNDETNPTLKGLEEAFNIEKVTKEFFIEISRKFSELVGGERKIGSKILTEMGCLKYPTSEVIKRKEFAVRLIGRLLFCWFLKKKRTEINLSLIPEDILSSKAVNNCVGFDYYYSIIEPLFFEVLNTKLEERKPDFRKGQWVKIPFLNGGLFEPQYYDFYEHSRLGKSKNVIVPNIWINDLFKLFETYNFTVDESTSVDIDISVDPEMLGRVFENLLAEINPDTGETARKSTGSYYTPRTIVEYMVSQSLKKYLIQKTGIRDDRIDNLLSHDIQITDFTEKENDVIIEALDKIKIIDPACGSGAFPMGILHKMMLILQKVDPSSQKWFAKKLEQINDNTLRNKMKEKLSNENWNYIHKLGIIQNSIYGVDIQPIATEISKLRFFLSLIVDEKIDDNKYNMGIEPLPNLEFKFVTANSLLGLSKTKQLSTMPMFELDKDINLLKELREKYLISYGVDKKKLEYEFIEIQKSMDQFAQTIHGFESNTLKLSAWHPFSNEPSRWFDAGWMFGIKQGFDIVIANPPYIHIRTKSFDRSYIPIFKKVFNLAIGQFDLFELFSEKAEEILNEGGIYAFIIPKRVLSNQHFEPLRKFYLEKLPIADFLDAKMPFEYSNVETNVILARKNIRSDYVTINQFDNFKIKQVDKLNIKLVNQMPFNIFPFTITKSIIELLVKLLKGSQPLSDFLDITRGYEFGFNHKAINKIKGERIIKGENIYKFHIYFDNYLINLNQLQQTNFKYTNVFSPPKLVSKFVSNDLVFALDNYGYHNTNVVYNLKSKNNDLALKYLLALLNSSTINLWFKSSFLNQDEVFPHIQKNQLEAIPIKKILLNQQKPFIEIVDKILNISKFEDYLHNTSKLTKVNEYERQIDQMVYKLYGITEKEKRIIEKG